MYRILDFRKNHQQFLIKLGYCILTLFCFLTSANAQKLATIEVNAVKGSQGADAAIRINIDEITFLP
ncbi:MAG: hypothetical protein WBJ10_11670, partial [Daejeonella sp.]|uniref:hypothetical protein n=1 Tax=Daejeonella sp. TaxID=2805397 RepID=UPI003C729780